MQVWKMNIKTAAIEGVDPFKFCLEKSIIGCGWPLKKDGKAIIPKDIDQCEELGREQYDSRGFVVSIHALGDMELDDLIWTRNSEGIYYIARVLDGWKYCCKKEYLDADVTNFVSVEYVEVGTVESVPGKIINCFRARSTVQRIHGDEALNASKLIYNNLTKSNYYKMEIEKDTNILDLLLPEDVEEVVSLYLQLEENYLIYSSTNKIDTKKVEFMMVKRDGSCKGTTQVKTGDVSLYGETFQEIAATGCKVYLFSNNDYVYNTGDNIIHIKKDTIINFMHNHIDILPDRIAMWLSFFQME